jgi:hypothetical protein
MTTQGQNMKKEIELSISAMRKNNVSEELLSELHDNLAMVDKMHQQLMDESGHSDLKKRDAQEPARRTLLEIIEDTHSGVALPHKKLAITGGHSDVKTPRVTTVAVIDSKGKWDNDERMALYNGLRIFGTDFSMIAAIMGKNRTQREVFKRFQREDKINPELVSKALKWHLENKDKIQNRFSVVLNNMNIDLDVFDPLDYSCFKGIPRLDSIQPLEFYLLNPPSNN